MTLLGPKPPPWFVQQSDGGSVPGGRFGRALLNEPEWREAAYTHDWRYYLNALMYPAPGTFNADGNEMVRWVGARLTADYELKENRKRCAKNKLMGWASSRLIFRGVRIGGRIAMRKPDELVVPPTLEAIAEVEASCIKWMGGQFTNQAKLQTEKWKQALASIPK